MNRFFTAAFSKTAPSPVHILGVGVAFVLFQFFLQLSFGVVVSAIIPELKLSAFSAGLLSSAFYYVYTTLQIPVGLLFDRKSTRNLLAFNAGLCALGCFIFANGHSLPTLFVGRLIIGAGSAFAFVGVSHLIRSNFPLNRFALLIGLAETLSFTLTVLGMLFLGHLTHRFGWRSLMDAAGGIGLLIAMLCWRYLPSGTPVFLKSPPILAQTLQLLKDRRVLANGLFAGLGFSVITVFAALWAVPFLTIKLNCSLQTAGALDALIFLGAAASCPLFGWLATRLPKRRPLLTASCLLTALLILLLIYLPSHNLLLTGALLFAIGLFCGGYMLAFAIGNELVPAHARSACTGFTNTFAMLTAPLIQPFIGWLLDVQTLHSLKPGVAEYQTALLILPSALLLAGFLVWLVPEKTAVPR